MVTRATPSLAIGPACVAGARPMVYRSRRRNRRGIRRGAVARTLDAAVRWRSRHRRTIDFARRRADRSDRCDAGRVQLPRCAKRGLDGCPVDKSHGVIPLQPHRPGSVARRSHRRERPCGDHRAHPGSFASCSEPDVASSRQPSRSRKPSLAASPIRCGSCWQLPVSCCWSRAPTSPICSSCVRKPDSARSPYGGRSAAGGRNIARYFFSESVLLAAVGGALVVALAWGGVQLLVAFGPANLPRLDEVRIDGVVLAVLARAQPGLGCGLRHHSASAPRASGDNAAGTRARPDRDTGQSSRAPTPHGRASRPGVDPAHRVRADGAEFSEAARDRSRIRSLRPR